MPDEPQSAISTDGGDNVFPLDAKFNLAALGLTKRLGQGFYTAHQIGESLTIYATGVAPNLQTKVVLEALPIRIYPPRYALFFYEPEIVSPAQKPFKVEVTLHTGEIIPKITIQDATGLNVIDVEHF